MKKTLFAIAALLLATSASAAEGGKPFLGVGVAIGGGTLAGVTPPAVSIPAGVNRILIPINVTSALRVEPFLGYTQRREKNTANPLGDDTRWASLLSLGAGVYLTKDVGASVELYGGGKLSIFRVAAAREDKADPANDYDHSAFGFGLAAVGGAEYYFSPRFSLGVEAELGFDSIESEPDVKDTNIGTAAFLTARVYFM
jgi:hypothetical protein